MRISYSFSTANNNPDNNNYEIFYTERFFFRKNVYNFLKYNYKYF